MFANGKREDHDLPKPVEVVSDFLKSQSMVNKSPTSIGMVTHSTLQNKNSSQH